MTTLPEPGDFVEITGKKGVFRGTVMPRHMFSDKDIVILKLDNGYNVGIKIDTTTKIYIIEKKKKHSEKIQNINVSTHYKDTISILGTGGTIASYIDYNTGAVRPAKTQEELLVSVPELSTHFNVRSKILFSILSEDMNVQYWQTLAKSVANELNAGVKGVIIPHGTDTMGYTAAALAFMLPELSGPVTLVGAQRSSDRPSSDAYMNLLCAVELMNTDLGEITVTMHGSSSDRYCLVHRGVRVRKMHTSRRDAFKSVNTAPVAKIEQNTVRFLSKYKKKTNNKVTVFEKMDKKVAIIYYYPEFAPEHLELVGEHVHGMVIMGTGLGHVSTRLISTIKHLNDQGKIIGITSQCLYGTTNLNVYATGRELLKAGVIYLGDMLPETAYVKMMWLLGNYTVEDAKILMSQNLRGELSQKRVLEEYLW